MSERCLVPGVDKSVSSTCSKPHPSPGDSADSTRFVRQDFAVSQTLSGRGYNREDSEAIFQTEPELGPSNVQTSSHTFVAEPKLARRCTGQRGKARSRWVTARVRSAGAGAGHQHSNDR